MLKVFAQRLVASSGVRSARMCSQTAGPSNRDKEYSFCTVCTTGYTYSTPQGSIGKCAVFFGNEDSRNVIEELQGSNTHVAAKIQAVIRAVKLAEKETPLLIRTDLKIRMEQLNEWARRGFAYHDGKGLMKNAKLLSDLHMALEERKVPVEFEFKPAVKENGKNYVTEMVINSEKFRLPEFQKSWDQASVEPAVHGDMTDSKGGPAKANYSTWPVVYTGALLKTAKNGFKSASYCTIWPNRESSGPPQRLAMVPVTLYRAQLAAIEAALKQALEVKMKKVVVVTGSPHFIRMYRDHWRNVDNKTAANRFFYERIRDLANNHGMKVYFRYEIEDSSPVWQTAHEKCQEGITYPLAGRDRTSLDLSLDEITRRKCRESLNGNPTLRVRFFKKGTSFNSGLLWDKVNDREYQKSFCPLPVAGTVDILLEILKRVQEENVNRVIIRTDSKRLMKSVESWMPMWKQVGWRTALHKRIADWEKWEEADRLLDQIQVFWEMMDPATSTEDAAYLEEFCEKKKKRNRRKSTDKVLLTDVITGRVAQSK